MKKISSADLQITMATSANIWLNCDDIVKIEVFISNSGGNLIIFYVENGHNNTKSMRTENIMELLVAVRWASNEHSI